MRTAGLLVALSALVAVSVHAGPVEDPTTTPVTVGPGQDPATKDPVTPAPVTKEPETKEPETKAPETKEPETKEPVTKEPETPAPPTTAPPMTPTPPPTKPHNGTECAVLENKDRLGFDIGSSKGKWDSCDAVCEKNTACQTWTWNDYQGGTCWLKSYASKLVDKAGVWTTECSVDRPALVCNAYKDIDFVGMDIGSRPAKSFGECCDLCNEFSGCTAYAWNDYQGGTCWLKKSVGHVVAKPGVWSSSTVQLYDAVCPFEYDVDFVGNDIGNKPAADAGVCCGLCKANKDCKAYSWSNWNGGTCWMKSGKGKTVAAQGVISAALAGF